MDSPASTTSAEAREMAGEAQATAAPAAILAPAAEPLRPPPRRATAGFMLRHPAHLIALGFGSGLSPRAPGTVGTLWAWVAFLVLNRWIEPSAGTAMLSGVGGVSGAPAWTWAAVLLLGLAIGWWASTRTAQHLGVADPGCVVWDEVLAFWLVLWVLGPMGLWWQLAAFAVFRFFDAVKPGPVRWADQAFKLRPGQTIGWRQGFGILFDDLVAALCTLLVLALALRAF